VVVFVGLVLLMEGVDEAGVFVPDEPAPVDVPLEVPWLKAGRIKIAAMAAAVARIRH